MTKVLAITTLFLTLLVSPLIAVEGKGLVCKCVKCGNLSSRMSPTKFYQFKSQKVNHLFVVGPRTNKEDWTIEADPSKGTFGLHQKEIDWWTAGQTSYNVLNRETLMLKEIYSKENFNIRKCVVYDKKQFLGELDKHKARIEADYKAGQKKNKI